MSRSWPLVSQFPLFGTGMGTFPHVEPLALHATEDVGSLYEHAHNDYLEDLIEGGVIRLGLRLAAIAFVFAYAIKAYRQKVGSADGALVLGLLFAFSTVVVHSFFEFGLYVAAIAVLAAVVCGHICNTGDERTETERSKEPWEVLVQRAGMLAGLTGCAVIGWLFWIEGSKAINLRALEGQLTSEATTSLQFVAEDGFGAFNSDCVQDCKFVSAGCRQAICGRRNSFLFVQTSRGTKGQPAGCGRGSAAT